MREIAGRHGLRRLIAPVRPSRKERYPLTPIDRYVTWRREDGRLLDPWMRLHERLGARVATALPRSMLITGTVGEWEAWTELACRSPGPTSSRRPRAGRGGPRRRPRHLLGAERLDGPSRDRLSAAALPGPSGALARRRLGEEPVPSPPRHRGARRDDGVFGRVGQDVATAQHM